MTDTQIYGGTLATATSRAADGATKDITLTPGQLGHLWDNGLDLTNTSSSRPTKPAAQVEWVYICLRTIIDACRGIQVMISTAKDDIVESGPAYDFLINNPDYPWMDFITATVGHFALWREVYWIFGGDRDGIKPTHLHVAGPNECKPVIQQGVLVGYELKVGGGRTVPLFIEDVHPLVDFNPYARHKGLGPMEAGKLSISTAYQAALLNEATLANGARIGVVLTTPAGVKMDKEDIDLLRSQFRNTHGGARSAGKAFLATGGVEVKPFTQTMADLQMLDLRAFDAKAICALFGVPPEIAGLNSEAQYAHGPAEQRFIQNTIEPMLDYIGGHITQGILHRFRFEKQSGTEVTKAFSLAGSQRSLRRRASFRTAKVKALQSQKNLFCWFASEDHPSIQQMLRERSEKMLGWVEKGVRLNQVIDAGDLPFDHEEWGDDWWVPMNLIPARYTLEGGLDAIAGPPAPEGELEEPEPEKSAGRAATDLEQKQQQQAEQKRLRIWESWVASWRPLERSYQAAIRKIFVRQQSELIGKLKKAWRDLDYNKAATKNADDLIARVVFDLAVENKRIRVINRTYFEHGTKLGAKQTAAELGIAGDDAAKLADRVVQSQAIRGSMEASSTNLTDLNVYTRKQVAKNLADGLEGGEGLSDLTKRIQKLLGENRARAQRIARTQTAGAVSSGRHEAMAAAGVQRKSWITSGDDHVRQAHKQAGFDYADGIPVDQPFVVGGESLRYPGDPFGSSANIVNCRCMEIARLLAGKRVSDEHYSEVYP